MERSKLREPVVAGQFYPASSQRLKRQIEAWVGPDVDKSEAIACMMPHAGYMYSGKVAVETASCIDIKDKVILLGPNHTGYGTPFSIMTEGVWKTPLGEVNIDNALARQILDQCKYLKDDSLAHAYEHSLEVELPILQYFKTQFEIIPIVVRAEETGVLKAIGKDIAHTIKENNAGDSTVIVASSDMTHYESQDEAAKKDKQAIRAILELNEDKLIQKVQDLDISMCGYAPVVIMLVAAKLLGATKARLVRYQTSGDVTGDYDSVVGYAGITIY